ncbi:phosphoenolpyruvate carboxykinase domain-containing protein [Thalassotalea ponticola]|uniref:phosphoenolpyruvate carboxykinase domain-containing protein n=1 Tax=Thalassotalea ponticola TaxID=1523392 RepID=UPI0025B57818|nr:phosphoenolpyruvate carboxykinase domain-containing protein [Thalassotalea ponticola]MDN3652842.1 phosphoenolpyruvate carboxykinase domain-containing protein [Thalassotalea ponticola]
MKHTLSFGIMHQLSDNIIELCLDHNSRFDHTCYDEYRSVIDKHIEKPYGVLVNQINFSDFEHSLIERVLENDSVSAIAAVSYSPDNDLVNQRFIRLLRNKPISLKAFCGYQLGRMKAQHWLALNLTTQNQSA